MTRWFRFYDDVINDPKVLKLSDSAFRGWVSVLCVTSKCGGKLPSAKDLAFYLRSKPQRVAVLLAELDRAGLLDQTEDGYVPHNWGGRQYISDSTERVKRHRAKRAAAGLDPQWQPSKSLRKQIYARDNHECVYCGSADDLTIDHKIPEMRGGTHEVENLHTACRACNASKRDLTHEEFVARRVTVCVTSALHETRQSTEDRTRIADDAGDARAKPLVSREAQELADELLVIAGHDLKFVPPGWCGAAMRVQAWLAEWPREIIVAAVKGAAARKRGPPANSVQFFENAVAEEFARQSAPLPTVEIREASKVSVTTNGTSQNRSGLIAAIDRQLAALEAEDGPDPALSKSNLLRISG